MRVNKAFDQFMKDRCADGDNITEHETNCTYNTKWGRDPTVPLNECNCDCYDKAIFRAGYLAGRGRHRTKKGRK